MCLLIKHLKLLTPFLFVSIICILLIDSFIHPVNNTAKKVDIIVVLAGDIGRLETASTLYKKGYSNKILLTPVSNSKTGFTRNYAVSLGIKPEDIISEGNSTSTYESAKITHKIMNDYKMDSAIIVSHDYHIKRVAYIFDFLNENNKTLIYYSNISKNKHWYKRDDKINIWFSEFKKIWGYRLHLYNMIDET